MLTGYGEQQCAHLARTFPYIAQVDQIVASPLKRTIYTALKSFPDAIAKRNLQVVTFPELQETSDLPCDTGSPIEELKREFADQPVSFDYIQRQPDWYSKKGKWAAEAHAIEERCRVVRLWLREQLHQHIVVITHGGLLHFLTEDWQGMDKMQGEQPSISRHDLRSRSRLWLCAEWVCSVFAERHVEHYETRHPDGRVTQKVDRLVSSNQQIKILEDCPP